MARAKIGDRKYIPWFYLKVYDYLKQEANGERIDLDKSKHILAKLRIKHEEYPLIFKELCDLGLVVKKPGSKSVILVEDKSVPKLKTRKDTEKYLGFY